MTLDALPTWAPLFLFSSALYSSALLTEWWVSKRRGLQIYDRRETIVNSLILLAFALTTSVWTSLVVVPFFQRLREFAPMRLGDGWMTAFASVPLWHFILLIFLDDLCFYVYHRTMHALRIGWAMHETHHSSNRFNIAVAAREPWVAIFFSAIFWTPLALLGFDPVLIATVQWINFSYQLLVHTELVGRLGPLELFMNTPYHHRVHHGRNAQYVDKNFGGVFIIWDKLFGSFEPCVEPVDYGVSPPLHSYSPLRITFNGLSEYIRCSRAPKRSRGRLPRNL